MAVTPEKTATIARLRSLHIPTERDRALAAQLDRLLQIDGEGRQVPVPVRFTADLKTRGIAITEAAGGGKTTAGRKVLSKTTALNPVGAPPLYLHANPHSKRDRAPFGHHQLRSPGQPPLHAGRASRPWSVPSKPVNDYGREAGLAVDWSDGLSSRLIHGSRRRFGRAVETIIARKSAHSRRSRELDRCAAALRDFLSRALLASFARDGRGAGREPKEGGLSCMSDGEGDSEDSRLAVRGGKHGRCGMTESAQTEGEGYVHWLDEIWSRRVPGHDARPEISVGVLLWPSFPLMSLAGLIEPLRHAADFADASRPIHCRWTVMGEAGYAATASCGVPVAADQAYLNPTDFDYVAVIGGLLPHLRQAPARHRDYLRAAAAAGVPLIGACTGAFVLAQEGLLPGRRAAVHPFHRDDFLQAFPGMRAVTRQDFVIDGDRITVPGGVSILSLMTELIGRHCGPDRAAKAVHQLSLAEHREVETFEKVRASGFQHAPDARVQRAIVLIERLMGQGVTPEFVAAHVGLGGRQLTRLFQETLGTTPKRFIIETRLRHAHWLVQNSALSMTAIAYQTGFADCAHFTTTFKARYGAPPSHLRRSGGAPSG